MTVNKWDPFPRCDRPLGPDAPVADDGRPVVILSDFSRCRPAKALAPSPAYGKWALVDYATERFAGMLLSAPRDNPAPEVVLPLAAEGWYAVYLWLMGGDIDQEGLYPADLDSVYSQSRGPAVKLDGDAHFCGGFRTLSHDRGMWPGLEACFWRYADLTGRSLVVRHQGAAVHLGAIELVPLAPEEVDAVLRRRAEERRLIVKTDSPLPAEVEPRIEQLRDRGVAAWIFGNEDSADLFAEPLSPHLQYAKQAAREIGAEWYVCDRPSLWSLYVHWGDPRADFFAQHPEWRCRDRDGTPTHQLSYAVPDVVDYMLARLRATAKNEPDGCGFFFNRDPGLVLFEPAAMDGFAERHGVDPLSLPERDPRLLDWRAEILTGFLRRARATLDEVAAERGCPRIKSVAVVLGDAAANRLYSFDVARWVREGLVDVLCPYPWTDYPDRWLAQGFVEMDIPWFANLVAGTACRLYPMWLSGIWRAHWTPEHVRPADYFRLALRHYAEGADGLSAWDYAGLDTAFHANRWLRLGQRDCLADWAAGDFPLPPKLRFTRLGGATPDRYPVGTGG